MTLQMASDMGVSSSAVTPVTPFTIHNSGAGSSKVAALVSNVGKGALRLQGHASWTADYTTIPAPATDENWMYAVMEFNAVPSHTETEFFLCLGGQILASNNYYMLGIVRTPSIQIKLWYVVIDGSLNISSLTELAAGTAGRVSFDTPFPIAIGVDNSSGAYAVKVFVDVGAGWVKDLDYSGGTHTIAALQNHRFTLCQNQVSTSKWGTSNQDAVWDSVVMYDQTDDGSVFVGDFAGDDPGLSPDYGVVPYTVDGNSTPQDWTAPAGQNAYCAINDVNRTGTLPGDDHISSSVNGDQSRFTLQPWEGTGTPAGMTLWMVTGAQAKPEKGTVDDGVSFNNFTWQGASGSTPLVCWYAGQPLPPGGGADWATVFDDVELEVERTGASGTYQVMQLWADVVGESIVNPDEIDCVLAVSASARRRVGPAFGSANMGVH